MTRPNVSSSRSVKPVELIGVARTTSGTCDWGYCDNYATALRYDPDTDQHLPVCDECKDKP